MQHRITPLFAIPLFQTHLGDLNIITKTWLKNLEYPYQRTGHDGTDEDLDEGSKGMYILDKPQLKNLRKQITDTIDYFVHQSLGIDDGIKFDISTSWANRYLNDELVIKHNHKNSMISGVYYIETTATTAPIVFEQAWSHVNLFHSTTTPTFKQTHANEYNSTTHTIYPRTGDLLLFPSHLEHTVPASDSKDIRYSLAFNCFARGHMGSRGTAQITL
jgi:uncharacterized protein (TIGR02466 family)